ncbi:MAG: FAD-binding protein [Spirochaetota bacterium]
MSNFIVLVKQVPDISQITDNAFNSETGTLIRTRLQNVINGLDAEALAFAYQMRKVSGDVNARIICLSMGPPMAEEVLRYALSRCADTAILLTDRALGGADTVATANPLAYAIRKIERDLLDGSRDYYVITGMQSVDGDTAQVPAQIAEELGIGCVPYVTSVDFHEGRFLFNRIISGGSQTVAPKIIPTVITVAKYEYPLYAGFSATRRANKTKIIEWSAADIQATQTGVKGSKTQVIRIFPPGKSTRKCKQVKDLNELSEALLNSYYTGAGKSAGTSGSASYVLPGKRNHFFERNFESLERENQSFKILADKMRELGIEDLYDLDEELMSRLTLNLRPHLEEHNIKTMIEGMKQFNASFQGDVWVVAEHDQGVIHPASLELIGKARELANSLEVKVGAVLAGYMVEGLARQLIIYGADKVYCAEHELLDHFDPLSARKAVADLISANWPQIVLFAATPAGRILAPMVSYRLNCGLTADCTSLDIRDNTKKGQIAVLLQTRPALGGNIMATIATINSRSQMATARPGIMKKIKPDESRTGSVFKHELKLTESDLCMEIQKSEEATGRVNFDVEVIVSGGKGLQDRDNYEELIDSLCNILKKKLGTEVEKGASRAAVERGFIGRPYQVGQTGTAVGPKLYLALGISGAIQHMIGVANTETIIAINSDPNAPIFKMCDYYMIGNVEEIIPLLVKELEA